MSLAAADFSPWVAKTCPLDACREPSCCRDEEGCLHEGAAHSALKYCRGANGTEAEKGANDAPM